MGEEKVGREFLMVRRPFLPLQWHPSGRNTNNPDGEFSQKGQLVVPPEWHPRDSSYAISLASLMAGHVDPDASMRNTARSTRTVERGCYCFGARRPASLMYLIHRVGFECLGAVRGGRASPGYPVEVSREGG
jgi:hypothetical protein